ncbi:hypothetical protein QE379_003537 [Sphingomonas sp. SORGH_AS 879]|nr:hypothetical protein [Sphingomonas sp. SORGH_AS_0879]
MESGMNDQTTTFEQVIALAIAAMEGADALGHRLAGNHIAAGLDMLRAAHRKREDERLSA